MTATAIEWAEHVWNPTTGCDRVSPGCDHCYALTLAGRLRLMGQAKYQNDGDPRTSGPGFGITFHPDALDVPLKRKKPTVWFVNSMSDLFHEDLHPAAVAEIFAVMSICPQHTFLILTKRPQRMAKMVAADEFVRAVDDFRGGPAGDFNWPLPNVWLGVSIESDRYVFRADHLRRTPAAIRFLSCEPLLGPLPSLDLTGIDWVIAGGESGVDHRPMHPDWVRMVRGLCKADGVPFHFKQWGGRTPKVGGRDLDGRTWDEMPPLRGPGREGPLQLHLEDGRTIRQTVETVPL